MSATHPHAGRPITGRTVLIWLVAFFGVVFAMNAALVRFAVSSFGGVETESSYKAGLAFKEEVAIARAQDARHWNVEASVVPQGDASRVTIVARDAKQQVVGGLIANARLSHPTDRRRDIGLELIEVAPGRFEGATVALRGQWDLVIDLVRDSEVQFRSKSRLLF
jgi:nitrogen fixation protein FixH